MGIGHAMRCLSLADALRGGGAECRFVCREHPGHIGRQVRSRGHEVRMLPAPDPGRPVAAAIPPHASWLGTGWEQDAQQTIEAIRDGAWDWLVVDHYGVDERWERALRGSASRIMVIDDLADRRHDCDLLLDQNLGRGAADYDDLVAASRKLIGPGYALLRQQFPGLRPSSLERRRATGGIGNILVSLGGGDPANVTAEVLSTLTACAVAPGCRVTVVSSARSPWLESLRSMADTMPFACTILADVENMAELMAESDMMIGAAGSTSWERCCLGVPGISIVIADNQRDVAAALQSAGATEVLGVEEIPSRLPEVFTRVAARLSRMSSDAAKIVDGQGCERVVAALKADRRADPIRKDQ
jgi:UDP-2,4-diacetamido-2,4,6-trideoxy-beta-L-altropyranose hydrolase